jgi:hypothetical protein
LNLLILLILSICAFSFSQRAVTFKNILPFLSFALAVPAAAQTCALTGGRQVESERFILSYRTKPAKLAVGEHFVVEMAVCAKGGEAAAEAVRVDGFMPEHNHGMNYKAAVKTGEGGRYLAEGMLFHMPGKWDFIFEVRGGGRTDRMTHSVILQ